MNLPERAPLVWRKSTRSGGSGAQCVELAMTTEAVGVRDTKNRAGGTRVFPPASFAAFVAGSRANPR